jgi:hypothetical protein
LADRVDLQEDVLTLGSDDKVVCREHQPERLVS